MKTYGSFLYSTSAFRYSRFEIRKKVYKEGAGGRGEGVFGVHMGDGGRGEGG